MDSLSSFMIEPLPYAFSIAPMARSMAASLPFCCSANFAAAAASTFVGAALEERGARPALSSIEPAAREVVGLGDEPTGDPLEDAERTAVEVLPCGVGVAIVEGPVLCGAEVVLAEVLPAEVVPANVVAIGSADLFEAGVLASVLATICIPFMSARV